MTSLEIAEIGTSLMRGVSRQKIWRGRVHGCDIQVLEITKLNSFQLNNNMVN